MARSDILPREAVWHIRRSFKLWREYIYKKSVDLNSGKYFVLMFKRQ